MGWGLIKGCYMHGPAGGLTGGLEGLEGKQEAWCGVRRRPLEKWCWKWSELGKVEVSA